METRDIPASVSQRLLWMIKHYRVEFGALNCPVVCRVDGPLDVDKLRTAIDDLTVRHESLRTTFSGRGARLNQHVHPPRRQPVVMLDVSREPDPVAAARSALAAELRTPLDPQQWPLRITVWQVGTAEHWICLNLHHLVTDAWSTGILLRDLVALYDRAANGTNRPLPAVVWQPADFVHEQRVAMAGGQLSRHQQYWRRQLNGSQTPRLAALDPDGSGAEPGRAAAAITMDLPEDTTAGLRQLARRERTTLFTVLLALFHAQLHLSTGQPDLSVASMFANRNRPQLRETVGLLAGMVLLRAQVANQRTFTDLVRHVHGSVIGAFAYQDLPFQLLPGDIVDTGGGRADDVMFNVMAPLRHDLVGGDCRFELVVPTEIGSRFPLELAVAPVGEHRLQAVLFRAGGWPVASAGERFLTDYLDLAGAAAADPELVLRRLAASG